MIEQTIFRTFVLPNRGTDVEIHMTIQVDFGTQEYRFTVEIRIPPEQIPLESREPLYSNGIYSGVHKAIHDAPNVLSVGEILVEIRNLEISPQLDILDPDEIVLVGNAMKAMTYEALYPIFREKGYPKG